MTQDRETAVRRRRRILAAVVTGILIAGIGAVLVTHGKVLWRFFREPEKLRLWIQNHGFLGQILYVLCMVLQIVLAIIPGEPLELMAGYAFGTIPGTLLCMGAAALGSMLVFGLVKKYGMHVVELFFPAEKVENLKFLRTSPRRTVLFTIVFAVPGTPKDLLCYFAGLTDMKWSTFFMISLFGRIPSILSSTLSGDALGTQRYIHAIVIVAVVLVLSGLGLLTYHLICRHQKEKSTEI